MMPGITASAEGVPAAPLLWTPAQITTQLWLDAADAATVTLATGVSQWNDKSGNARHVAQATGAQQPAYGLHQLNGINVLTFDGGDRLVATGLGGLARNVGAVSIFVVRNYTTFTLGSSDVLIAIGDNTPDTARCTMYQAQTESVTGERIGGVRLDSQTFATVLGSAVGGTPNNVSNIMAGVFNYASAQVSSFRDGNVHRSAVAFHNAGSTSNTESGGLNIGSWIDGTLQLNGRIAEVIVTHSVDATQRQLIEGYLAWKWGLQANLPVSHPYKNAAPTV